MKISAKMFLLAVAWLLFLTTPTLGDEHEWPRQIDGRDTTIIVYQPQLESFANDILSARAAVSVQRTSDTEPVFGAVWFEARAETDRETRNVALRNVRVLQSKFPEASADQTRSFEQLFNRQASGWNLDMSLDQMLAMLEQNNLANIEVEGLKNDPPKVYYRQHPALLVMIDGDPKLQPVSGSKVMRVVNSPMYIVFEPSLKSYYLKIGDEWFSSHKARGNWRSVSQPPSSVLEVAARVDFPPVPPEVQGNLANKPEIIVSYEPAELIVTAGEPQYALLEEAGVMYVDNSDSDIFLDVTSQKHYVTLSGRWYRSDSLNGPWTYVPADQLPADFARIPEGSVKEHVLAHIPDTVQAREAILDSTIPQTARVERDRRAEIEYDGTPEFVRINGTGMAYAINTATAVLRVDGRYYACLDAVWFVAASPYGPWRVAITIPQDIYSLPPSVPIYYVRYVYIYGYTPDIVYVGYTPGYLGTYVYRGRVVYGTGYDYRPWYRTVYYPRPLTWGFHVNYNTYYGWTFGVGLHGHYGNLWYSFGSGWWGPVHHRQHYYNEVNININRNVIIKRPGNIYRPISKESWRRQWQERSEYRTRKPDNERVKERFKERPRTREEKSYREKKSRRNDVYIDRKGEIYRRTDKGWQKREKGDWRDDRKLRQKDNRGSRDKVLEKEYRARERGDQRIRKREVREEDREERRNLTRPDKKGKKFRD
ncbi:MAG: hypothetical protein C0623_06535 [Desulfuromonas sp.]|nr:MAG: hypothetical protein C0623_06535 [Desulfuromonas sp.]